MTPAWFLLQSGSGQAAENMAWDEALLEAAPRLGQPVLRFYGWSEPAASFGYFQKYAEVERMTTLRPLVRRPTGGGLVPHDADWTYSLVFPPSHPWYALSAIESYRRVHEWIGTALTMLGAETVLAPAARKAAPGQCFVGAEKFDLLWQDRKIAGAAQRRTRNGLLIQGSVQPPLASFERTEWERAFCSVVQEQTGVELLDFKPGTDLFQRAQTLAAEKYSQAHHNQRR